MNLIGTLPMVTREKLLRQMILENEIKAVRYNVGMDSPFSPEETLRTIFELTEQAGKKLWVDLKGRQLRIIEWADPDFCCIKVNHNVEVEGPAKVFFRGDRSSEIKFVNKNRIFLHDPPEYAVGRGQAINIIGESVKIYGYLTESDIEYIKAACKLGIVNFMLSFIEKESDIDEVIKLFRENLPEKHWEQVEIVLKIESAEGLEFLKGKDKSYFQDFTLMAARDDLSIQLGEDKRAIKLAIDTILRIDDSAILGSRIFSGIEKYGVATAEDILDLHNHHYIGFTDFLLSDGLCHHHFDEAMKAWQTFISILLNY